MKRLFLTLLIFSCVYIKAQVFTFVVKPPDTLFAINTLTGEMVQLNKFGAVLKSDSNTFYTPAWRIDSMRLHLYTQFLMKSDSNLYSPRFRVDSMRNALYTALASKTTYVSPVWNNTPARLISTTGTNNTFTISSTKAARVFYSINFSVALIAVTSNGSVTLDYSTNAGSTWTTVDEVSMVYGVSVTITTNTSHILCGEIPAGALVRINRTNNSNTTTTAPTTRQLEVSFQQ